METKLASVRKIACVLKKSEVYDKDYVERLKAGLDKYAGDFEFLCIEDSPWPGWWSKMSLFDPAIRGNLLYFDLDTVLVGPIEDLFVDRLTVLADFNLPRPKFMATGVMYLPESERMAVWEAWINNPELHMSKHGGNGDGGFISKFYKFKADRWQDVCPEKIVSYKIHCKQGVPEGASVVCFHGRPRPREVGWNV